MLEELRFSLTERGQEILELARYTPEGTAMDIIKFMSRERTGKEIISHFRSRGWSLSDIERVVSVLLRNNIVDFKEVE